MLRLFDELKDTIKHFKCEPPGLRDITDNSIVDGAVHFQEYKCDCSPAGNQGRGCGMYLVESGCTCPPRSACLWLVVLRVITNKESG